MNHTAIIMVAPNGARKTAADHPAIPVSIEQTWREALECFTAGATVIHAHVRGEQGEHVLDAEKYRRLLNRLKVHVPDILVQVTTEAVGKYTPAQQAQCVYDVEPSMISMAVREMAGPDADLDHARQFYHWCAGHQIHIQHIVYDAEDVDRLFELKKQGVIAGDRLCALFVLGRYAVDRESVPDDIDPFLQAVKRAGVATSQFDWFVCAFGRHEHDCAMRAISLGGHARIGFENNLLRCDGSVASNNAEQVDALKTAAGQSGIAIASHQDAARILGLAGKH